MRSLLSFLSILLLVPSLAFGAASSDFDAVDDVVDYGSAAALDDLTAITVVSWFRADGIGENGSGRMMTKDYNSTRGDGWNLMVIETNRVAFGQGFTSADTNVRTIDNSFSLGTWAHAVATADGSPTAANTKIYVNGVEPGYAVQGDGTGSRDADNAEPVLIGNRKGSDRTWDGQLAHHILYNRELTQAEASQVMWLPETVPSGRLGYWPIWGDATETDLSGNGNTGTVTGATASETGPPVMFGMGLPL